MAITRNNKRVSESPPSPQRHTKLRAIVLEPGSPSDGKEVDVGDYIDVEAEHDSESGDHSDGQSGASGDEGDSISGWLVSDDVNLSDFESSDTMSDGEEMPLTLTGSWVQLDTLGVGADKSVRIGTVDVEGNSQMQQVPVTDDTDARMSDEDGGREVQGDSDRTPPYQGGQVAEGGTGGDMGEVAAGVAAPDPVDGMTAMISRAGSLSLHAVEGDGDGTNKGKEKAVADLFVAVKDGRPVQAKPKDDVAAKKKISAKEADKKKPEPKQGKLALKAKATDLVPDEQFVLEDGQYIRGRFLRRLVVFTTFANDTESMFYIRNEPGALDWSSGKVNVSRLVVHGQATRLRLMTVGQITWNGMLPVGRGDNGPVYPTKPKVAIKCLRDADFLHFRKFIHDYSNSRNVLELQNMSTVSAYTDVGERRRGSDEVVGVPFSKIYDGQLKYIANKEGMDTLRPNQLLRGDIVMLEVSVARYFDIIGKTPNWSSSRVYFHLEAVTLLLPYDASRGTDQDKKKKYEPKSGPSKRFVAMDESF